MAESIIKSGRKSGFTVIYNSMLRDKRLSLKAKGLFAIMTSLPDNWEYSISGLAAYTGVGKDMVRSALNELQSVGYLEQEQRHDSSGKFASSIYVLQDEAPPLSGFPTTVIPTTVLPSSENPTQQNTIRTKERLNISPIAPAEGTDGTMTVVPICHNGKPCQGADSRPKFVQNISPEICERILEYAPEDQDLQQAILDLLENRRVANKKPVKTMRAMDGILRDLDKHSGGSRDMKLSLLDKAVKCNWLTVYALKPDEIPRTGSAGGESEDRDGI